MNQSRTRVAAPDGLPLDPAASDRSMRLSQGADTYTLERKPVTVAGTLER